jgi:hypothetical protein
MCLRLCLVGRSRFNPWLVKIRFPKDENRGGSFLLVEIFSCLSCLSCFPFVFFVFLNTSFKKNINHCTLHGIAYYPSRG